VENSGGNGNDLNLESNQFLAKEDRSVKRVNFQSEGEGGRRLGGGGFGLI
jgi:hypothetical protein